MKTKNLITVFLLIFTVSFFACDNNRPEEPEISFPREISFTEFSLVDTSCQWINFRYGPRVEVVIINSSDKLKNYTAYTNDCLPEIDFTKKSLVVANATAWPAIVRSTATMFVQLDNKYYEWEIEVTPTMLTSVPTPWKTAIIVDKIDVNSMVDVKITVLR